VPVFLRTGTAFIHLYASQHLEPCLEWGNEILLWWRCDLLSPMKLRGRADSMVQVVEDLPRSGEALSSNSTTTKERERERESWNWGATAMLQISLNVCIALSGIRQPSWAKDHYSKHKGKREVSEECLSCSLKFRYLSLPALWSRNLTVETRKGPSDSSH
jgi:hypothetical protein